LSRLSISLLLVLAASGCSTLFPANNTSGSSAPTGCDSTATKHVAPGGYYVAGNTVCTAGGQAHLFHGVDRPSLEWSTTGEMLSASDFQLMSGDWKANVVRIALNQDFWLPESPMASSTYQATVDTAVKWAEQAGMDVILDLHWSDAGVLGSCSGSCQQLMADTNSITFWSQVAAIYKNDGRVLFELYNEPHDISWPVWKSGGVTSAGWTAAGMQQLYDAVRAAGADNLVIAGGVDYAYDLTGVPQYRIDGYNVLYATHPYGGDPTKGGAPEKQPQQWDGRWGFLTHTDPVIVTEFGDSIDCGSDAEVNAYNSSLITYSDQHSVSWTSWAWYTAGCTFPSIISDWTGTPSSAGTVVQAALQGYTDPSPAGKRDGGVTATGGTGGAGAAGAGGAGGGAAGGAGGTAAQDGGAAGAAGGGNAGAAG
jgi:endoglucanase